jgi:hypothetical protein
MRLTLLLEDPFEKLLDQLHIFNESPYLETVNLIDDTGVFELRFYGFDEIYYLKHTSITKLLIAYWALYTDPACTKELLSTSGTLIGNLDGRQIIQFFFYKLIEHAGLNMHPIFDTQTKQFSFNDDTGRRRYFTHIDKLAAAFNAK